MRAKEMAARLRGAPVDQRADTVSRLFMEAMHEVYRLRELRRVRTDAGAVPILEEIADCWEAFRRRAGEPWILSFAELMALAYPDLYEAWRTSPRKTRPVPPPPPRLEERPMAGEEE